MTGDADSVPEKHATAGLAAAGLAQHGAAEISCHNCTTPLIGPYCAACGQPRDIHRRSIGGLIGDFFSDIASFDSRILRTALALLFEPGELPLAFREGRTQRYMPAVRLYLFVSLIFFLALGATGIAILQLEVKPSPLKITSDAQGNAYLTNPAYDKEDPSDPDNASVPRLIKIPAGTARNGLMSFGAEPHFFAPVGSVHTRLTPAQLDRLRKPSPTLKYARRSPFATGLIKAVSASMTRLAADPAAINGPLTAWIPRALFLLLPLYALILALVNIRRRKQFFFVDHLVFSLSIHTFFFVALLAAVVLAQFLAGEWVALLLLAAISVYILLAMKRFYAQSWFWTSVKFVTVSGLYVVFCLLPALAGVIAISFLGGSVG